MERVDPFFPKYNAQSLDAVPDHAWDDDTVFVRVGLHWKHQCHGLDDADRQTREDWSELHK